ncbi:hypothetical protein Trydic_g16082 [Trypoxylus dichotomus]
MVTRWLSEVLSTRTAEVTVGEQPTQIRTTRGTPQGGVCSPLMWSPVADELLNRLTAFGVRCIGYADDIAIECGSEVKYLGITLHKKLLWNKHIALTTNKAIGALMICRTLAGKTWVCNPNILRWLYINILTPTVTYGAIPWFQKVSQVTTRNTLDKSQRLACVCITGAMRTCPAEALEIILDLIPLHIVVEGVAHAAMYRLTRVGTEGNGIAF